MRKTEQKKRRQGRDAPAPRSICPTYLVLVHKHDGVEVLRVKPVGRKELLAYLTLQGRKAKSSTRIAVKIDKEVNHVRAETAVWRGHGRRDK
jgi:hypothetical protein